MSDIVQYQSKEDEAGCSASCGEEGEGGAREEGEGVQPLKTVEMYISISWFELQVREIIAISYLSGPSNDEASTAAMHDPLPSGDSTRYLCRTFQSFSVDKASPTSTSSRQPLTAYEPGRGKYSLGHIFADCPGNKVPV